MSDEIKLSHAYLPRIKVFDTFSEDIHITQTSEIIKLPNENIIDLIEVLLPKITNKKQLNKIIRLCNNQLTTTKPQN